MLMIQVPINLYKKQEELPVSDGKNSEAGIFYGKNDKNSTEID